MYRLLHADIAGGQGEGDFGSGNYETKLTFRQSIVRSGDFVNLANDADAPGDSLYYGTDAGGAKGFHSLPSAGVTDHGALTGLGDDDHPQYLIYIGDAEDDDDVVDVANDGGIVSPGSDTQVPTEAAVVDWVQAVCVLNVQVGWSWVTPVWAYALDGATYGPELIIDGDTTTYGALDYNEDNGLVIHVAPCLANSVRVWAGQAGSVPGSENWEMKVEVWNEVASPHWTTINDGLTPRTKGQWVELSFTEQVVSMIRLTSLAGYPKWIYLYEVQLHCFGLIHSAPP